MACVHVVPHFGGVLMTTSVGRSVTCRQRRLSSTVETWTAIGSTQLTPALFHRPRGSTEQRSIVPSTPWLDGTVGQVEAPRMTLPSPYPSIETAKLVSTPLALTASSAASSWSMPGSRRIRRAIASLTARESTFAISR